MMLNLSHAPTLETERLLLRLPDERDFEPLADMYADPEVMTYLGGPVAKDITWRTLATFIGHWCLRGYGLFTVVEKQTGDFVGRVGLINPAGWPALEIGWAIRRHYWGVGMATESARAVISHEIPRLRPTRLISLVDERNTASSSVANKLGAIVCGKTEFMGSPTSIFAYSLPDAKLEATGEQQPAPRL